MQIFNVISSEVGWWSDRREKPEKYHRTVTSAFLFSCGGEAPAKAADKPAKTEAKPAKAAAAAAPAAAPAPAPKPKPAEPAGAEVTVAADGIASLTIEVGDNMEY